jgi:hypothetical protein
MTRFEQFLRERRYLGNISERSLEWYRLAFRWLPNDNPSDALKDTVVQMRRMVSQREASTPTSPPSTPNLRWNGSEQGAIGVFTC